MDQRRKQRSQQTQAKEVQMKVFSFLMVALLAVSLNAKQINLNSSNMVAIRSEVSEDSMTEAQIALLKLVAKRANSNYTIYIVLDSPGGDITAGLNFIEFAKTVPNVETVTLFAASMASAIVQQLPGRRNIIETGTLMFHRAKGGLSGQFEDGELESRLTYYKNMVKQMEIKNAYRMHMTLLTYKAAVKDELWILGTDAIRRGGADEIVSVTCSLELSIKPVVQDINFLGMTFKLEMNGCPLIKGVKLQDPKATDTYNKYKKQFEWSAK